MYSTKLHKQNCFSTCSEEDLHKHHTIMEYNMSMFTFRPEYTSDCFSNVVPCDTTAEAAETDAQILASIPDSSRWWRVIGNHCSDLRQRVFCGAQNRR